MRKVRTIGVVSETALEDEWQRRATTAAIGAARRVVQTDGPIGKRAEQAACEQLDTEQTIRLTGLDPEPWDAGAVAAILPELADVCSAIDWSKPIGEWPRDTMVEFLLTAMRLIRKATIARDLNDKGVSRKSSASVIARQANATAGGSLMTADEWNDEVPTF